MRIRQKGLIFSYVLTERTLQLRIFIFFPIAGFRLSRLVNMRRASIREFYELNPRRLLMPWKFWAWPVSLGYIGKREISRYVLRTNNGTRIWLRLKPEIHYHLRRLTNEAQLDDNPPVSTRPSAWAKPVR